MKMKKFNELLCRHVKTTNKMINYGTAGFRDKAAELGHIMFRMGVLAALRSRVVKATIGAMITASHNPEEDNGLKLIDPKGEMLDSSWEQIATNIANVKDDELFQAVNSIITDKNIDMRLEASVYIGRDTRASSEKFANAVIDGVIAADGQVQDYGLLTTPQLHYIVLCKNGQNLYGEPSEVGYYQKLAKAFIQLNGENGAEIINKNYVPSIVVDGANGVGAIKLKKMQQFLGNSLNITIINDGNGKLNQECGADFVKVQQQPPKSLELESGKRYLSYDGDADRIIYYYKNSKDGKFHMLDGDKIAVLLAAHFKQLLSEANLADIGLSIVQTAYANGNSTFFMKDNLQLPVYCVPTGVKHLHHRSQQCDIGVYFEANGHGTVTFTDHTLQQIKLNADNKAAANLLTLIDLINQTVGDAISDMLVVETILRNRGQSIEEWDNIYTDLPNRQLKVNVKDRNVIQTGDAERKCLKPDGLQNQIDSIVAKYGLKSRAFVRPSGTEDVVRVYAESNTQQKADSLAKEVANVVFDLANGVGNKY